MPQPPVDWLLSGESWVNYRTRLDLLGQAETEPGVQAARATMLDDPLVQGLVAGLQDWPGTVIASHKSAGQSFHRLSFAADLGLRHDDPGVGEIVERVMDHRSEEGPFQLTMNIPTHFGGSGQDQRAWALCDAPLSVYALGKMGLSDHPAVRKAADYLAGLARENGWPCAASKELGKWHGPGRRSDPCPFATLAMLKALSVFDDWRDSPACRQGAEALLWLWEHSRTEHPYIFYMGDDFRKLKVPLVWYDLVHVLDVLTRFPWLKDDPRLLEMLALLSSKMDPEGRFKLESIWAYWKSWEFGQKKTASRWLTLTAWRIIGDTI